jgi:hypothetical protein
MQRSAARPQPNFWTAPAEHGGDGAFARGQALQMDEHVARAQKRRQKVEQQF